MTTMTTRLGMMIGPHELQLLVFVVLLTIKFVMIIIKFNIQVFVIHRESGSSI